MTTTVIGSEAWENVEVLKQSMPADEHNEAHESLEDTHWDNLIAKCTALRVGISCSISDKFTFGTQNLVRLVEFEDSVKWVARVALEDVDTRMATNLEDQMMSQVATHKFLK